jgi:hypothetical protein
MARRTRAALREPSSAAILRRRHGMSLLHRDVRAAQDAALRHFAPLQGRVGHVDFMLFQTIHWAPDPMAQWGVEYRDPHGDRRLIELLLGFPREAFVAEGMKRGLIRAMGDGLVPDAIRLRTAMGEQVPEIMQLMTRDRTVIESALEEAMRSAAFGQLFDVREIRRVLDLIYAGQTHREHAAAVLRVIDVGLFIAGAQA